MTLFPAEVLVRRLSLVKLSGEVARATADIGRVTTEGEVVRPTTTAGGRTYFTLRDRVAQLTVMCPPSRASRCRTVHGERVEVTGLLNWAPDRGQLLMVADEVVPVGAGAIAAALAERRQRLVAAGLLDRPRRPIPRLPAAIGVVCGSEAAVRADIESVVSARFPGYPVVFVEVGLSGPGAPESIIAALRQLDCRPEIEVVVLARGGGDAASLLAFSDEELCLAICAAGTPVVSAIGHEGDRPLCDAVADLRCGTPSMAAAAVVPDRAALSAELGAHLAAAERAWADSWAGAASRLARLDRAVALRSAVVTAERRLERAEARLAGVDPRRALAEAGRSLAAVDWQAPVGARLAAAASDLASRRHTLDALDPVRVLARGFAVVRRPDGTVVRDPGQVVTGEVLELAVARGRLRAAALAGPHR